MSNPHCSLISGSCYNQDKRKKYKQRIGRGKLSTHAYMAETDGYADGIGKKGKKYNRITYCWISYCPSCQEYCYNLFLNRTPSVSWEMNSEYFVAGFGGVATLKQDETKFEAIERVRSKYPDAKIACDDSFSYFHRSIVPRVSQGYNAYNAAINE